jgi:anti-sigma B factor antagonist
MVFGSDGSHVDEGVAVAAHATRMAGDTCVVDLSGEIDMLSADIVEKWLCDAGRTSGASAVVADLSGVEFLDSSGVRALLRAKDALDGDGIRFSISEPNAMVERILRILGLYDLLA